MIAQLSKREEVAQGTLDCEFSLQDQEIQFRPGQFFSLTLLHPLYTDEKGYSRFLGFVNSPAEKRKVEILTRSGVSAFKKSLAEMQIGTEVEIGALGGRLSLPEDTSIPLFFIAGGIGIAPFMSIFRYVRENNLEYSITLLYSNTNQAVTAFHDELSAIAKENPRFKYVPTMTQDPTWTGEKRRIDTQFLNDYLQQTQIFYIAGTPRFVPSMVKLLRELNVPPQQVHFEIFTGY